jgi:hypothetical protein
MDWTSQFVLSKRQAPGQFVDGGVSLIVITLNNADEQGETIFVIPLHTPAQKNSLSGGEVLLAIARLIVRNHHRRI